MRVRGFEVPPRSAKEIWQLAEQFRAIVRTRTDFFPLYRFAAVALPKLWPEFNLTIGEMDEMGTAHALTFHENTEIRLREDVYDGLRRENGRDRFTLAHEFGHLFMHNNALARRFKSAEQLPPYRDSEWQADHYGGAFLMPLAVVQKFPDPWMLATECGVSEQAAQVRINYLKKAGQIQ
jgi:hypothetical protein